MKVMIAGSFDPITLGHADLISRSAALFDSVTVCIAVNSEKKYMYGIDKRRLMVETYCKQFPNVTVDVCDGLVAEYAVKNRINAIVKGVRTAADFDYEYQIDCINKSIAPIETLLLPSSPKYMHLSSTAVREMIKYGRDLSKYVPESVLELL